MRLSRLATDEGSGPLVRASGSVVEISPMVSETNAAFWKVNGFQRREYPVRESGFHVLRHDSPPPVPCLIVTKAV